MSSPIARRIVKPRRPRLLLTSLAATVGCVLIAWLASLTPVGAWAEGKSLDARFTGRADLPAKGVVVVGIDERTLVYSAGQWPVSRTLLAQAIERLRAAGVAAIVVDYPLDTPGTSPGDDQALLDALKAGPGEAPVVLTRRPVKNRSGSKLGQVWVPYVSPPTLDNAETTAASGAITGDPSAIEGMEDVTVTEDAGGIATASSDAKNVEPATPSTADPESITDAIVGVTSHIPDTGGVIRTQPTRASWGGKKLPSTALQAVEAAGASTASLPDDIRLNWRGPRGSFRTIAFSDIAYGLGDPGEISGDIVVIGPQIARANDSHRTPYPGAMSSAEITATAVADLRAETWLRDVSTGAALLLALGLSLVIWASLLTLPLLLGVPLALASLAGWAWYATELFDDGVAAPMTLPIVAGVLSFATLTILLAALSVRDRLRIRSLFARYVPADVVRELMDTEDPIEMGGAEREITVLFSDIRGFTSMSEHVDALEMVGQLNEYFAAMVDVVGHHKGTLDKFLGDGMMAIFGAPGNDPDHAQHACSCALEMLDRLAEVNSARSARSLPELKIGIGVHTGVAVVGNVGSPLFRVDFTAIGDTVNLAARLEAASKELGTEIVVSANTKAATGMAHNFHPLGSFIARGRTTPTEVFGLSAGNGNKP